MADCQTNIPSCPQADEAARKAVKSVFAILGIDVDDPAAVEEFRKDLRFGQTMRRASDRGFIAVFVLMCTALAVATWSGLTMKIGGR